MSTQVSALVTGEVLSDRYRLEERLFDATSGRAVWRGTDMLLNRKVAVEVQTPGGPAAEAALTVAATVAHVHHPNVIDVYDVVDETDRAFIVREWASGTPLNKLVTTTPLDAHRAIAVLRGAAAGIAALHAAGATHGNLIPRSVMVNGTDEVVLVDMALAPDVEPESDVRALGSLLYTALTGRWPGHAARITEQRVNGDPTDAGVTGGGSLPTAVWVDNRLCSPRQMRAGVPGYLDTLVMELLDESQPAPTAAELVSQLEHAEYAATQPTSATRLPGLSELRSAQRRLPLWARIGVPVTALVAVAALMGVVFGVLWQPSPDGTPYPQANAGGGSPGSLRAVPIENAEIVDPGGDGTELAGAHQAVDGDQSTSWRTDDYTTADFGNLKPGMGVLLDLGRTRTVQEVRIWLDRPGAAVQLLAADRNRGLDSFQQAAKVPAASNVVKLVVPAEIRQKRYWMVWITQLPQNGDRYGVGVREILPVS